jgi:hypothetical protein
VFDVTGRSSEFAFSLISFGFRMIDFATSPLFRLLFLDTVRDLFFLAELLDRFDRPEFPWRMFFLLFGSSNFSPKIALLIRKSDMMGSDSGLG